MNDCSYTVYNTYHLHHQQVLVKWWCASSTKRMAKTQSENEFLLSYFIKMLVFSLKKSNTEFSDYFQRNYLPLLKIISICLDVYSIAGIKLSHST
jgi:hypothetical protein